jgi:hypothetical protein
VVTKAAQEFQQNPFDEDDSPPLSRGAMTLLTLQSNNAGLPPIQTSISQDEFEKAFRKWSKGTSTSPSDRHLGHYKCFSPMMDNTYSDDNPDTSENIMGVYHNVATAALA